ncbi:hypothetical protein QOZ80_3BG0281170 [Eleusine coracana subsp. coracana]|nr:hypothetical protein QOZ80_3BG0281170 [Eleusine coracana subsp. coracana]
MMANTEGYRLVRCPKCLNVLPEPANVTVYRCGGCDTTLRAKIRTISGRHVATKQVRQDTDNYSVATSVNNGVPPPNKDEASAGAAIEGSCIAIASSTGHDSNGTISSNESCDVQLQPAEKNAVEDENIENKDHEIFEGQNASSSEEGTADQAHSNAIGTPLDSDKAENHAVEQCAEKPEVSKERENNDSECCLNASESNILNSESSKVTVSIQDSEQKGAEKDEHTINKKSYLVRVQSRSCDLRASINSLDFHSARTSLQSKSFRISEPLQSKIMNSVDELKGDLSELFSKPSDCKPRAAHPPRPKQDMSHAAITSSAPLAAYHPAARHSGHATRLSRSGQVAPGGLPSLRYRRYRAYSGYPVEQMEMRPCRHECCHSCRPPCYRSCNHEPVMHKPLVQEIKRRPPPRHHCRPVLRGSPFVICSNCLNLVQLPTDFTVPSKGTRRLKCGSCSEVLSYSYRDPTRKNKLQSPFGGDDEYSTDDYEIHRTADDHKTGFDQGDPVSYSEEYGLSFGVSYSTSTEDGQPLYVSRNSSFNTIDERVAKDGKLHRLMGYSSASEMLRHSPDLFESFDGRTPDTRMFDRKGKGVCDDSGEQDSPVKRPKARRGGLQLQGILKKGIHSLESLKLRS